MEPAHDVDPSALRETNAQLVEAVRGCARKLPHRAWGVARALHGQAADPGPRRSLLDGAGRELAAARARQEVVFRDEDAQARGDRARIAPRQAIAAREIPRPSGLARRTRRASVERRDRRRPAGLGCDGRGHARAEVEAQMRGAPGARRGLRSSSTAAREQDHHRENPSRAHGWQGSGTVPGKTHG